MRRKLPEISCLEVILCIFVVMIHVLSESISFYEKGTVLSFLSFSASRILTFAVPCFVMTAGIKFAYKYETTSFSYFSFLKGRILKIYFPYLFCATIYYLYFVFCRKYFAFDLKELSQYLFHGSIAAPFYFVIIMMQLYLLAPIWLFLYKNIPAPIMLGFAAIITLLSLVFINGFQYSDRVFLRYTLYWLLGCYIGSDFRNIINKLCKKKLLFLFTGIFFTVAYVISSYLQFCEVYYTFFTEIIKVFYCIFASLMYLSFMPKSLGFLSETIAPATFYIYLIHCLIIFVTQSLLDKIGIVSMPARFFITAVSAYLLSFSLSLGYLSLKKIILSKKRGKNF